MTADRPKRVAFITGITGQDGSYLAEQLLDDGTEVHGIIRRSSSFNTQRIMHIFQDPHEDQVRLHLHYGDLSDGSTLARLLEKVEPTEIYNLGAQSHVRVSFDMPEYTFDVTAVGTVRLLEAIRDLQLGCRFYQASSSEMFGNSPPPQHEDSPLEPRSPYAVAKVAAYWMVRNYREAYGLHASNGILFNHESPRRGETFVTRKIARAIPRILNGQQDFLYLGNLEARRDWGHARDYVDAMVRMVRHDVPDDYVIGTGTDHSVREFLDEAFGLAGLEVDRHVRTDPRYLRPTEVDCLRADPSKARDTLGWTATTSFKELVREMVEAEMTEAGLSLPGAMGSDRPADDEGAPS